MIVASEPVGRFIAFANLEKKLFSKKSIGQDIANLIDLIIIRSKNNSIEEVANGLLENIFDLRITLLEWLADNNKDLKFLLTNINEYISVNLQLAPFSSLADSISDVLINYQKIVSPIFNSLPNSFKDILETVKNNKLSYDIFKILSLHPSPQVKYQKEWIDSSLKLELGLIIADLVLSNQIQFPRKRIELELIGFLNSAIIKFGAYSIFTGFWIPDTDDRSILTNNMKIFSATIELENKSFYKSSKDSFYQILNN